MSEQGAIHEGAIGSGSGVETRANPPDIEAPSNGHAPPEWLAPIEARMDELRDQNAAIAERLQAGYDDYGYDEFDGDLSDEDFAAAGFDADDLEADADPDIIDLVERSIDARVDALEAENEIEERNWDYEDLKSRYPMLQDDQTARAIVGRAQRLAMHWNPEIIDSRDFVGLIEATLKAHMMERVRAGETIAQAQQPPGVQLESGSGAGGSIVRDRQPREPDWGARIVEAANRLRPRI